MQDSKGQKLTNNNQEQNPGNAEQWIPTDEDKKEFAEFSRENAKANFTNIKELEQDFAKRLKALQDQKDDESGRPLIMSLKEFEKWESEAAQYYSAAVQAYEVTGLVSSEPKDMPQVASLMYSMYDTGEGERTQFNNGVTSYSESEYNAVIDNSIEAYAGHYYRERYNALLDAVRSSNDPEKLTDEATMENFIRNATAHLRAKNANYDGGQTVEQIMDYGDYRTNVHNDTIRSLNDLNRLARKYGTHTFTFRDFWTTGLSSSVLPRTTSVQTKMRFDRDIVEAFYANIDTMKDREEQNERSNNIRARLFR